MYTTHAGQAVEPIPVLRNSAQDGGQQQQSPTTLQSAFLLPGSSFESSDPGPVTTFWPDFCQPLTTSHMEKTITTAITSSE